MRFVLAHSQECVAALECPLLIMAKDGEATPPGAIEKSAPPLEAGGQDDRR